MVTLTVVLYLGAIVLANLLVAWLGPGISIVNAFLLIGLDLTSRDRLHDAWEGKDLRRNMVLLIAAGSLLTIALNMNAGRIAVASFVAFTISAAVDTITYHRLRHRTRMVRMNSSNLFASVADSIVFPLLAFGWPPLVLVMLGQMLAKILGGFVWIAVLDRIEKGQGAFSP